MGCDLAPDGEGVEQLGSAADKIEPLRRPETGPTFKRIAYIAAPPMK